MTPVQLFHLEIDASGVGDNPLGQCRSIDASITLSKYIEVIGEERGEFGKEVLQGFIVVLGHLRQTGIVEGCLFLGCQNNLQ